MAAAELRPSKNPRKWRFTWEAQSHIPTLRLFLFDSHTDPSVQCKNLAVRLYLSRSLVLVNWFEEEANEVSLGVPVPRVLIDDESPVSFRALEDHIEVKLVLLLPVDHPIVSSFDLVLNSSGVQENGALDFSRPLVMNSDVKSLSSTEGVHFFCRNCSFKLTKSPLRDFMEMPSVNWREVADNWFGNCCCSFGGISEKLVNRYAGSYMCSNGICMLNSTTVTLCKDDIVGCEFPDGNGGGLYGPIPNFDGGDCLSGATGGVRSNHEIDKSHYSPHEGMLDLVEKLESTCLKNVKLASNNECKITEGEHNDNKLFCSLPLPSCSENLASSTECCAHTTNVAEDCFHGVSKNSPTKTMVLLDNQKSFLNGCLGDVFMARSSNLSTDVGWTEFVCPQCSYLLGAFPTSSNASAPLDDGVRLFKCYITCLPVNQSDDVFRKYTLERMFANQILESAEDELSFRTLIRDLTTKSPTLQIVLLNPNSWCCTGYCLGSKETMEPDSKLDLQPVIKVLFSDCRNITESQLRTIEDWVAKNQPDEVYMLEHQIEKVIGCLKSAKDTLPPSCASLQGLPLSSMQR